MKRITWFFIVLSTILFIACQGEPSQEEKKLAEEKNLLKETLPGIWESVSVRVLVNSAESTDSSYVFEVREEEWGERLGTRPIRYYFQLDNKYRQEFIALNGELMSTSRGMWNAFSDTLMLIEPNATYQYIVSTGKGLAEFRTLLDWDGDGQEDDEYLGVYRQVSRTVE